MLLPHPLAPDPLPLLMRFYIIRALFVKEVRRHVANRRLGYDK